MRIFNLLPIALVLAFSANASKLDQVEAVVKKYAESVACGSEYGQFGFKAVKVVGNPNENNPYEDYYAVVWQGDFGCQGGSGGGGGIVTTVAIMAGSTPVVLPDSQPIRVPARILQNAAGGKGLLIVESASYKEGDPNCCPSGTDSFIFRFDKSAERMVLQK